MANALERTRLGAGHAHGPLLSLIAAPSAVPGANTLLGAFCPAAKTAFVDQMNV